MSSRRSARASASVKDIEAEIEKSGNSRNFVDVDQSAAASAGLLAIAAAITGGVNIDLNGLYNQALETDKQNRQEMLTTLKSAR